MKLKVLGSGGWMPTERRQTSCFLVDTGKNLIILDFGTGIYRLSQKDIESHQEVHIVLSHYHFDHIVGFTFVLDWAKERNINIYGPGELLHGKSCKETLLSLFKPPHFMPFERIANKIKFYDYDLKEFKINSTNIQIIEQKHTGGSYGITIDDKIHYATDTSILDNTFKRASKVRLLLHDCWTLEDEKSPDHSSLDKILPLKNKYNISHLGLIHINPTWSLSDFSSLEKHLSDEKGVIVMKDLVEVNLNK